MSLQRPNPQGTGINLVVLCTIDDASGVFHASH
jgi:hypothetical protein